MKLTDAQVKALLAVEQGKVTVRTGIHKRHILGADVDVIEGLLGEKLIAPATRFWRYATTYKYGLTPAGRAALEELRKGKE